MGQGRAQAIQDWVDREEMLSKSCQESTKNVLNGEMRGYWHISLERARKIKDPNQLREHYRCACCEQSNPTSNCFEKEGGNP